MNNKQLIELRENFLKSLIQDIVEEEAYEEMEYAKLVRCKDCKHSCKWQSDDFCSKGEK